MLRSNTTKPRAQVNRGLLGRIATADERIYSRLARTNSRTLDILMPALSRAADFSILWMVSAAAMRASGRRRAKRAAARALGSIAVSSLITNQGLKRLHFRPRPDSSLVTARRIARRLPVSSSFPSGHSASAAAFATSVAVEHAALGALFAPIAAGVGISRVATGAHYPSDVVVGWTVGATVAALGAKIAPPVAPVIDQATEPVQRRVGANADGAGLAIVVNERSGPDDSAGMLAAIAEQLPAATVHTLAEGDDVAEVAERLAAGASALGVAGGDGTVGAVAEVASRHGLPLAVFPAGTFNHFAKDIRVLDVDDVINAVREGVVTDVDLGRVNGRVFLNTASLGSYPEFVTEREKMEPRLGKRVAAAVATWRVLRSAPRTRLRVNGEHVTVMMFFVGNGEYQPVDFMPAIRPTLSDGLLDVRFARSGVRGATWWLIASTLTGRLGASKHYRRMSVPALDVEILDPGTLLSRDGEVDEHESRLEFRVERNALTVFQPPNPGL